MQEHYRNKCEFSIGVRSEETKVVLEEGGTKEAETVGGTEGTETVIEGVKEVAEGEKEVVEGVEAVVEGSEGVESQKVDERAKEMVAEVKEVFEGARTERPGVVVGFRVGSYLEGDFDVVSADKCCHIPERMKELAKVSDLYTNECID